MIDCIFDDHLVSAVVRDAVIKELRRSGIYFPVVISSDRGSGLLKKLIGRDLQIGAGDFNLSANVGGGDSLCEFVGGLVVILGDLTMALLMFGDVLAYIVRHPDGDVQLQVHFDVRDGERRMVGIRLSSLSSNRSVR